MNTTSPPTARPEQRLPAFLEDIVRRNKHYDSGKVSGMSMTNDYWDGLEAGLCRIAEVRQFLVKCGSW